MRTWFTAALLTTGLLAGLAVYAQESNDSAGTIRLISVTQEEDSITYRWDIWGAEERTIHLTNLTGRERVINTTAMDSHGQVILRLDKAGNEVSVAVRVTCANYEDVDARGVGWESDAKTLADTVTYLVANDTLTQEEKPLFILEVADDDVRTFTIAAKPN